ncbi:MAG: 30S ribosomal protein S8 [Clostridia bacterium]|nr:30S ribosomal protein S8 [Clostridia bacterium]
MKFDPIADMLTRIRNALTVRHSYVEVPASQIKKAIADLLVSEGFVASAEYEGEGVEKKIKIVLKYGENGQKVISGIKRISKPGLRVYCGATELPVVLNGLGIAVISTSKGIMTDKEARAKNLGGEVIAYVW